MVSKDRGNRSEERQDPKELPNEPASPGATVVQNDRDLPGEGGMPRRKDMDPGDHLPRDEDA